MIETFEKFYRTMGRSTAAVLIASLASFGLALVLALLGVRHAAESFDSVGRAIGLLFVVLLVLFLVTSLIGAFIRWLERRARPAA